MTGQLETEAVVVDHDAGEVLARCVASLQAAGASRVVVVDNAVPSGCSKRTLALEAASGEPELDAPAPGAPAPGATAHRDAHTEARTEAHPEVLEIGLNLGYGSGANRGAATCSADFVLICNPDVAVDQDALRNLAQALEDDRALGIVGPLVLEPDGTRYPSARRFPSLLEGAGHVIAGRLWPQNKLSRRYRMSDMATKETTVVDWVSGSCMLVRRQVFEELGGFDESYFMYGEDVDICWRAHRAGYQVGYVPTASVTHIGGVTTARTPYRMLAAHHRSALRFANRSLSGHRRIVLPAVAVGLGLRFVTEVARQASSGGSANGSER
jgi:N-acetylglucosaminyl-diphospho-decaprenol L-rhamnosyltransferase